MKNNEDAREGRERGTQEREGEVVEGRRGGDESNAAARPAATGDAAAAGDDTYAQNASEDHIP